MQVSNVSSSTPAAIRFWLEPDWIVAFDSVGVLADLVEPGTTVSLPAIDELLDVDGVPVVDGVASCDSILPPSLAQPPTISPRKRKLCKSFFPIAKNTMTRYEKLMSE